MDHQLDKSSYQTGYTRPQKSHNGTIAFLLVIIVFLGGIATVSGLLNIRLFRALSLQSEEAIPVEFVQLRRDTRDITNPLGISVKTLSVFDQKFYHLPQGVYITDVAPGSHAALQGIMPGDILISVQNTPVTDRESLETLLKDYQTGQILKLVIFRDGRHYTAKVAIGDKK